MDTRNRGTAGADGGYRTPAGNLVWGAEVQLQLHLALHIYSPWDLVWRDARTATLLKERKISE